jgi:hypothetical protein
MSSADRFLSGFAQSWRDEHSRLLNEFSPNDNARYFAALEQAWRTYCDQWWKNLHHVVPQTLTSQLEAALRQTQLCMTLVLNGGNISAADLASMVDPMASLRAALLAQHERNTQQTDARTHAHRLASQALMAHIGQITQCALTAAREQLHNPHESKPRELYAHFARVAESAYHKQVGKDETLRLIGHWVNTHVEDHVARSTAPATTSMKAEEPSHQQCENVTKNRLEHAQVERAKDTTDDNDTASPRPVPNADEAISIRARVTAQMSDFSNKLAAGASSLASLSLAHCCGVSPHEIVFQCDNVKLLRYRATRQEAAAQLASALPPLLVIYSLINRPYILDISTDRSLIRALCNGGRDVYLIDWGYPRQQDASLDLNDYVNRYLHCCVTHLQTISEPNTVDLIGICQGGPFALCYTALEPARVRRLALMGAPVDFHTEDFLLARWLRHVDVDALVNVLGNVPGYLLNWSFVALKRSSYLTYWTARKSWQAMYKWNTGCRTTQIR